MLLANMAKSASIERMINLKRSPVPALSPSAFSIAQLLELYNQGAMGKYKKKATYDYLAYLFADLAKAGFLASTYKLPTAYICFEKSSIPPSKRILPSRPLTPPSIL